MLLLNEQSGAVAKAYNQFMFKKALGQIRKVSNDATEWLLTTERHKFMWASHSLDPLCKFDLITNYVAMSFNS